MTPIDVSMMNNRPGGRRRRLYDSRLGLPEGLTGCGFWEVFPQPTVNTIAASTADAQIVSIRFIVPFTLIRGP